MENKDLINNSQEEYLIEKINNKNLYSVWIAYSFGIIPYLGFLFLITGLIISYVFHFKTHNNFEKNNYKYAIRTGWFNLLWILTSISLIGIGIVLQDFGLGYTIFFSYLAFIIYFSNLIWFVYRVINGFLKIRDKNNINKFLTNKIN